MAADVGHYESSLQFGASRLQVDDAEVSPDRQTEITFVLAPATLHMQLVDSDLRPIDDKADTVWEIEANPSQLSDKPMRFKGARLDQMLQAGSYHIRIYSGTHEFTNDVTLVPGQDLDVSVQIGPR